MTYKKHVLGFYRERDKYGEFSNWYRSEFEINGHKFISAEQYMMHSKAVLFGDNNTAEKILAARDQGTIKSLGRGVKNYEEPIWAGLRQITVYKGLYAKFSQNEDLKDLLLSTGKDIIAECSPTDKIWGIGLDIDDPKVQDIYKWKGTNLLGFALMEVREALK